MPHVQFYISASLGVVGSRNMLRACLQPVPNSQKTVRIRTLVHWTRSLPWVQWNGQMSHNCAIYLHILSQGGHFSLTLELSTCLRCTNQKQVSPSQVVPIVIRCLSIIIVNTCYEYLLPLRMLAHIELAVNSKQRTVTWLINSSYGYQKLLRVGLFFETKL